ncbi:MAG: GNAT family N-acetyltransferase [Xanthomonadales bacterium]|nr:GNAT family N-acetyltransferase [Xanthomonadales bacterium]
MQQPGYCGHRPDRSGLRLPSRRNPAVTVGDFPRLHTERLLLRVPEATDFERYAQMLADPDSARHIGGVLERGAAWRRFLQMPGAWLVQGFAMFSVIDRGDGRWLGQVGPWQPDGWPGTEVGWALHPEAAGRGIAFEAATAAIDWAFAQLGWSEVIHCIAPDNLRSQRLAQRLGARLRGPVRLPAPFQDAPVEAWGQSLGDWHRAGVRVRSGSH